MFVRLRGVTLSVTIDVGKTEFNKMMMDQKDNESGADDTDEFNSDDEQVDHSNPPVKWYQFNVKSSFIVFWDSFFGLIILYNIIWAPLAIAFYDSLYGDDESETNWVALDLFFNSLWAVAFFINCNRVDFVRQ